MANKGSSKQVTLHLRQLAAEAESIRDDGEMITRAEALAMLIWNYALGWEEPDPDDPNKTILHRPQQWAIQLLYDRMEGKAPNAVENDAGTMTAADRVGELAVNSVNAMTMAVVGDDIDPDDQPPGPPTYRKSGDGSE